MTASAASSDLTALRAEIERRDSLIANLKARAALAGYQLLILDAGKGNAGTFVIARWGLQRECDNLAAVEALLLQVGAK